MRDGSSQKMSVSGFSAPGVQSAWPTKTILEPSGVKAGAVVTRVGFHSSR